MSSLVIDERTALEDLLESCYGAIYAYGIVAAYLTDPDEASRTRNDNACIPFLPSATPNSQRVPFFKVKVPAGSAEACKNTSSPSSV